MKVLFRSIYVTLFLLCGVVSPSFGAFLQMDVLPAIQVDESLGQASAQLRTGIVVAESISFPHEFEIDSAHDVLMFKNESTGKSIGIKYSNTQDAVEITPLLWRELTHAGLGEAEQFSWSYGSYTNQRIKAQRAWKSFLPATASVSAINLPVFKFKDNGAIKSTGTTNRTLVAVSENIPIKYMTLPGGDVSAVADTGKMSYTYELPDGRLSSIVSGGGALPSSFLTVNVNDGTLPFTIVYDDSYGEGFRDVINGAERRAAMEYAVSIWASKLYGTVPVEIHASLDPLGPNVLGSAGPLAYGTSEPSDTEFEHVDTVYVSSLANQLLGSDFWPTNGDIGIQFSTDSIDDFYFGTDGHSPPGDYDFVTVVLHELTHGLGFLDGMQADGSYFAGDPFVFDHQLYYNGNKMVNLSQSGRASAITSQSLFWDGSNAKAANGGGADRDVCTVNIRSGIKYIALG